MKAAKIAFLYLGLAAAVAAIWIPEYRWQFIITMAVLLIAASGIEVSEMKSEKDDQ